MATFFSVDNLIMNFDLCLRSITGTLTQTARITPEAYTEEKLTPAEEKHAAGLMRVNHSGEVCAQALYLGQSLTATSEEIKQQLNCCADEEVDHLFWCQNRLQQLNSHVSYLNPIWFSGSFLIGMLAGMAGDKWNLGFLAETEIQVSAHLNNHLNRLPSSDTTSRAIIKQMCIDENAHAATAQHWGAAELPTPIKTMMQTISKGMTTIAYYV